MAEQKGELVAYGPLSRGHNQSSFENRRLSCLEALLLSGMPGDRELRLLLEQLYPGPGGKSESNEEVSSSLAEGASGALAPGVVARTVGRPTQPAGTPAAVQ